MSPVVFVDANPTLPVVSHNMEKSDLLSIRGDCYIGGYLFSVWKVSEASKTVCRIHGFDTATEQICDVLVRVK